eukprot:3629147-Rhodomonas_salina.6
MPAMTSGSTTSGPPNVKGTSHYLTFTQHSSVRNRHRKRASPNLTQTSRTVSGYCTAVQRKRTQSFHVWLARC